MLSVKTLFRENIAQNLKSAKEMASFLIVENALLATTYPDVCLTYMMYITVGEVGVKRTCGAKRTPMFSILSDLIK